MFSVVLMHIRLHQFAIWRKSFFRQSETGTSEMVRASPPFCPSDGLMSKESRQGFGAGACWAVHFRDLWSSAVTS